MNDIYTGKLVRFSAYDPEELGKAFSKWSRDSEYWLLMDAGAARLHSAKHATAFFEKGFEELSPAIYFFGVRTLADDQLIGELVLEVEARERSFGRSEMRLPTGGHQTHSC